MTVSKFGVHTGQISYECWFEFGWNPLTDAKGVRAREEAVEAKSLDLF